MKRSWGELAVGLVVGAVCLVWVSRSVRWDQVGAALGAAELVWLAPVVVFKLLHFAFKGLRWRLLVIERAPMGRGLAIRLTLVGFLLNTLFPARIGELGRPYLLTVLRPGVSLSFAVATVVGNKLFDLCVILGLLGLAALTLPLAPEVRWPMLVGSAAGLAVLGLGVVVLLRRGPLRTGDRSGQEPDPVRGEGGESRSSWLIRRARPRLAEFSAGIGTLTHPRVASRGSLLTLGVTVALLVEVWCSLRMFGLPGGLSTCVLVLALVGAGSILPAPPTNLGNYHFFASAALLLLAAASRETAVAYAFLTHGIEVGVVAVGGGLSLIGLPWRRLVAWGRAPSDNPGGPGALR